MIVETILISTTIIVVASLIFANKIMERENNDYGDDKIRPYEKLTANCALCGQQTNKMTITSTDGLLIWHCPKCDGKYKTHTKK